ncbi:shikimate kinase [Bdellovibrio sp. HCB2-146]|uniref:shikimate kinase n=1 Tax=Bdellovibrio sp. HCB2-146 TaxID=3394362 RepID=UPI0039BCAC0F
MITAVVGHRGTGKSELMKRMTSHLRDYDVDLVDLDEEIEKKIGKNIFELVMQNGEPYFRELERQVFLESLQKATKNTFIVMGAGFDMKAIPETVRVLWVRRKSDLDGRIFLDRPRLDPDMSPIDEFRRRAEVREVNYANAADEVYEMPEGIFTNHHRALAVEKGILTHTLQNISGTVTLLPSLFEKPSRWEAFKSRFTAKGISLFELRDDLLSVEQIRQVMNEMPHEVFLLSFRKSLEQAQYWLSGEGKDVLDRVAWMDWALEIGSPDDFLSLLPWSRMIVSSHEKNGIEQLAKYESKVAHSKWAPLSDNFSELWQGHSWQQAQSAKRSFLPRSAEGRWNWYRAFQKGQQFLNFWRYDEGSAADQPSLFQWMMTFQKRPTFAAVLGDPVYHSYTPLEHSDFFAKRDMSVFAVTIYRDEFEEALPVLQKLGLRYAAVTSPHKQAAASATQSELRAVNTLFWSSKSNKWLNTSTDDQGFMELIEGVGMIAPLQKEIFVWGGGGTLEMVEKAIPHASYFASRTGQPREGSEDALQIQPKILIWAAPRQADTQWPPLDWHPSMVFDLNYKEDSMGREYALRCGAHYQSGLTMFQGQAQGQRAFWLECEGAG